MSQEGGILENQSFYRIPSPHIGRMDGRTIFCSIFTRGSLMFISTAGYEDQLYFSRLFKAKKGIAPGHYLDFRNQV